MESVTWLIVAFLIFWLLTTGALVWLMLRLRSEQTKSHQLELNRQESLYKQQLQEARASSTESSTSAREQSREMLAMFQEAMEETTRAATSGVSSANQSLMNLLGRIMPLLTARDAIAAGQLSTITAPAEFEGGPAQPPYTAEDDAISTLIDSLSQTLEDGGFDASTARAAAASYATAQR
jgi:hypothetical protein